MTNRLVAFLCAQGAIGPSRAMRREVVASLMSCSARTLRELAEESRLSGDPDATVCYSTDSDAGGYFVARDADDLDAMLKQITAACLQRLRQRSALKRAIAKIGQRVFDFRDTMRTGDERERA